ncbi:hypothetical protein STRDD11_00068 [Streptococcus sp. DD11]|nr:hypothetical protein STRDD11_00068 [Streptococcus sp. DD11]
MIRRRLSKKFSLLQLHAKKQTDAVADGHLPWAFDSPKIMTG